MNEGESCVGEGGRRPGSVGFTLVETALALAIAGLICGAALGLLGVAYDLLSDIRHERRATEIAGEILAPASVATRHGRAWRAVPGEFRAGAEGGLLGSDASAGEGIVRGTVTLGDAGGDDGAPGPVDVRVRIRVPGRAPIDFATRALVGGSG